MTDQLGLQRIKLLRKNWITEPLDRVQLVSEVEGFLAQPCLSSSAPCTSGGHVSQEDRKSVEY